MKKITEEEKILEDSERVIILQENVKMLLRELDKVNLRYKDMFNRNTLLEVISKKEPKEILLQK
jgi:hypothetical protein